MASTSAFPAPGGGVGGSGGVATGELAAVLARWGELTDAAAAAAADVTAGDRDADAARVDQIALLERIGAAAAATQAAVTVGFARSQVAAQQQAVLADPRAVGRGIADQLALACRVSPAEGSRRSGVARALYAGRPAELAGTAALLRDGRISAHLAGLVVAQTRHLDPERRRAVDQQPPGRPASWPAAPPGGRPCWPAATPTGPTRRATSSARADRAGGSAGGAAPGPGHHGHPDRVPAGAAGGGVSGRVARAHRRGQEHR